MAIKPKSPRRATGKTFRAILEALRRASEGETIAYTTAFPHVRQYYMDAAKTIAHSYLPIAALRSNANKYQLHFPDAGRIYFCVRDFRLKDSFAGIKVDAYINDD